MILIFSVTICYGQEENSKDLIGLEFGSSIGLSKLGVLDYGKSTYFLRSNSGYGMISVSPINRLTILVGYGTRMKGYRTSSQFSWNYSMRDDGLKTPELSYFNIKYIFRSIPIEVRYSVLQNEKITGYAGVRLLAEKSRTEIATQKFMYDENTFKDKFGDDLLSDLDVRYSFGVRYKSVENKIGYGLELYYTHNIKGKDIYPDRDHYSFIDYGVSLNVSYVLLRK